MFAAFAAEAGFLVAAEGAGGVEFVVGVCPDDAGFEFGGHLQDAGAFVGPDAGAEAVGGVVGFFHGFLGGAEGEDGEDGAEDFLAGDAVAEGDIREERGGEVEPALRESAGGLVDFRAFADAAFHEFLDFFELLAGVDGADVGVLVEGVADAEVADAHFQFAEHFIGDAFLDEEAGAGAADMALVEEDAVDDAFDGLVDGGVLEHDVRGLAAELEGDFFSGAGEGALDEFPDGGGAGEGDFRGGGVVDDVRAGVARAGDDVDDPRREAGVLEDGAEFHGRDGGGLGGLEDDGVSAGEGGGDFPRQHEEGEIPRDDLADDAERGEGAAGCGVVEFVGPAGVVEEVGGGDGDIEVAGFADGLAAVDGLGDGEFAGPVLEEAGDAEEVFPALGARGFAPLREGGAGCGEGGVHIGFVRKGDFGDFFLVAGGDGVEKLFRFRGGEFAVDEEAVLRGDVGWGGLGGGVVFPEVAEEEFAGRVVGAFGGHGQ